MGNILLHGMKTKIEIATMRSGLERDFKGSPIPSRRLGDSRQMSSQLARGRSEGLRTV
jgi:hypothetical protein